MSRPLHRRVADDLRREILEGFFPPGSQLPSEHDLAHRFGIARGTVRQALATLRAEGAIASRRGARGTVLAQPRTQSFSQLLSFSAWAESLGEEPGGRVVELVRREATAAETARLALDPGAHVVAIVRIRLLSGSPVMVERTTFPLEIGQIVASLDLEHESIYESLARHGIVFARARHLIDTIAAGATDARLLDVPRRTPLLRQRRRTTSPDGRPLEVADDRYRGDALAFVVDNSVEIGSLGRLVAEAGEERDGTGDVG